MDRETGSYIGDANDSTRPASGREFTKRRQNRTEEYKRIKKRRLEARARSRK
jgi:hypothetical protein